MFPAGALLSCFGKKVSKEPTKGEALGAETLVPLVLVLPFCARFGTVLPLRNPLPTIASRSLGLGRISSYIGSSCNKLQFIVQMDD